MNWIIRKKKCPHCGGMFHAGNYRGHLKSVVSVGGRNVCAGMKEHPNYKALQANLASEKTRYQDLALPAGRVEIPAWLR